MAPRPLQRLNDDLDGIVDATPRDRDRFVDLLRAVAIGVVVMWHWVLSMTHWQGGELTMPNPLHTIPGSWLATWLLQIMPLFFFVGGFANLAGWRSVRRDGGGAVTFYRQRLRRLLLPPAAFVAVWVVLEVVLHASRDDYRGVLEWGAIVLMPFWFLAAYVWVVALVPVTARLHARGGIVAFAALAITIALVDLGRFGLGMAWLGYVNSALVWVLVHQIGYFYRDGTLVRVGWRGQLSIVVAAGAALLAVTSLPDYPRSMVATEDVDVSHMWPTTGAIGLVALLQAGLAMLLRPTAGRWLKRRSTWKAVVAVNAVILTVYVWHMTAKVAVIGIYEATGFELIGEATALWWLQRPLWLLAPGVALLALVALFAPLEARSGSDDG